MKIKNRSWKFSGLGTEAVVTMIVDIEDDHTEGFFRKGRDLHGAYIEKLYYRPYYRQTRYLRKRVLPREKAMLIYELVKAKNSTCVGNIKVRSSLA